MISGTPTTPGTYIVTSVVTDSLGGTDNVSCTIIVSGPPLNLSCGSCGNDRATVGTLYSSTLSVIGGKPGYTFSIAAGSLPAGLTLNPTTGVISGTPTATGNFSFTTKVVDANGISDTAQCALFVVGSPVNLDCGSCGSSKATVGVTYTSKLTVSGGKAAYTFSILSGSLPPGMTLNTTTGTISGSPTTAGTYTFTSKVVDANGNTDTATCTIVVGGGAPLNLDCGVCGTSSGKVGTAFSATFALSGGKAPFTYSITSGSLPAGLTLNASTGVISGTPTTAGTFTFTTKVTDAAGSTDTATCTIVVTGSAINLDCGACKSGKPTLGQSYSNYLSVTGANGSGNILDLLRIFTDRPHARQNHREDFRYANSGGYLHLYVQGGGYPRQHRHRYLHAHGQLGSAGYPVRLLLRGATAQRATAYSAGRIPPLPAACPATPSRSPPARCRPVSR